MFFPRTPHHHTVSLSILIGLLTLAGTVSCKTKARPTPQSGSPTPVPQTTTPPTQTTQTVPQEPAGQCTSLTDCPRLRFDFKVKDSDGVTLVSNDNIEFEINTFGKLEIQPTPESGTIGKRKFKFEVRELNSKAKVTSTSDLVRITWTPSSQDSGSFTVVAKDLDYCELKKKEDKKFDCDLDTSRIDDEVFLYTVVDPEETPEARAKRREEQDEQRRKTAQGVDCLVDKAGDVVGVDEDTESLFGAILKGITGGVENAGENCRS